MKHISYIILLLAVIGLGVYQHHENEILRMQIWAAQNKDTTKDIKAEITKEVTTKLTEEVTTKLTEEVTTKLTGKITALQDELKSVRTVYVYSLEEAMQGINASEKKNKFEEEAQKLNEEVLAAEKKIKNIKDKNVKEDFSDVYLNSLRLKRDNLVEEYQKMLEELRDKVNKSLDEIATEKNVNAIFLKSSVAVMTPYVVDVTPELIEKLKK